jgi:hypothetical protein
MSHRDVDFNPKDERLRSCSIVYQCSISTFLVFNPVLLSFIASKEHELSELCATIVCSSYAPTKTQVVIQGAATPSKCVCLMRC